MTAAAKASYKDRKVAFVSNLSGSSLTDINLVTLVSPAALLLWAALQKRRSFASGDSLALIIDYLLNVCAILFAFTAYSSAPVLLNVLLAVPAVVLLLPLLPPSSSTPKTSRKKRKTTQSSRITGKVGAAEVRKPIPTRPFITNYRGAMMVTTVIAILAVDFPVFPRRFAKAETWGTSLMDIGVGSFVFSAGLVSARQLLTEAPSDSLSERQRRPGLHQRLLKSLRHSLPLFVLGLIRLYSVKGLDYAEHVTEYGVHWNFFFTLGLLPPFVELSDTLIQSTFQSYDLLAIAIALLYEVVLNNTDLLSYILISPRGPSLLSKNREGIFSFIGYLAIFLSGRGTGTRVLPLQSQQKSSTTKRSSSMIDQISTTETERRLVIRNLWIQAAKYICLFTVFTVFWGFNLRVSRRLANAPYIFWISSFNNVQISLFALVEHVGPKFMYHQLISSTTTTTSSQIERGTSPTQRLKTTADDSETVGDTSHEIAEQFSPETASSQVMQSFNRNGLPIFLIANLFTGLVNLTFNTLDTDDAVAMAILSGYTAGLTYIALTMDRYGIRIKF